METARVKHRNYTRAKSGRRGDLIIDRFHSQGRLAILKVNVGHQLGSWGKGLQDYILEVIFPALS